MSRTSRLVATFIITILYSSATLHAQAGLTMRAASSEQIAGWQRMELGNGIVWVSPVISLTSADIQDAEPLRRADGANAVSVTLTNEGFAKLQELMSAQYRKMIAVVFDGQLLWAPLVTTSQSTNPFGVIVNTQLGTEVAAGIVERIVARYRPASGPTGRQDQPTLGRITGQVVDANGGMPVPNARVILESQSAGPSNQRERITDAAGSFVLEDLRPRTYFVHAEADGYSTSNMPQGYARPVPLLVNLQAGQTYPVTLRIVRAGSISGRVYDVERRPVAKAEIQLLIARYSGFGQRMLTTVSIVSPDGPPSVQTDEQGEYRVHGLPPGDYYVRAAYSTGPNTLSRVVRSNSAAPTYYPGVVDPDQAAAVKVTGGLNVNAIDFTLAQPSSVTIAGRISNPLVQTTRGIYEFYLVPRNARLRELAQRVPNHSTAEGTFELRDVRPGSYDFYVSFRTGAQPDDFRFYVGRAQLEVADRNITNLVLGIEPGVSIPGRIELDTTVNVDLRNVTLLLSNMNGMPGVLSPTAILGRSRFIQDDGTFILPNAARGQYFLTAVINSGAAYIAAARLGTQDVLGQPFEINSDTTGPLIIEIHADSGTLEGIVTTRDGAAVANGQVMLVPPLSFREDQTAYKGSVTDNQGRFRITAIRPGIYTAYALSQREEVGAWMNPEFITPYLPFGIEVNVGRGQTLRRDFMVR